jgi:hypothetical protein
MATDLTVGLINPPGTLLRASDPLGRAGINIEGVCETQGVYHILVEDAVRARRALIDAGLDVQAEQGTGLSCRMSAGRGDPLIAALDREAIGF